MKDQTESSTRPRVLTALDNQVCALRGPRSIGAVGLGLPYADWSGPLAPTTRPSRHFTKVAPQAPNLHRRTPATVRDPLQVASGRSDSLELMALDESVEGGRDSVSEVAGGPHGETAEAQGRITPRPRIQSVARAVDLLLWVAESENGLTSKALADRLEMSRQGTYHLLHTLISSGVLARTEDDRYVLGLRIGTLAAAFERHITAAEHLAPHVRALARETGETSYAAGWRHGEIVVMTVARGTNPVQAAELSPGTAGDAHARASGKLLLAQLNEDALDDYVERHPLRARTDATITDRRALDGELQKIRDQQYAVDSEEFAKGLCCVAVSFDGGRSPFVIGLSVPASRYSPDSIPGYLEIARDWSARPR